MTSTWQIFTSKIIIYLLFGHKNTGPTSLQGCGITSHWQPQQCRGAQNSKGGPKWPELCIKTVIRLCTSISQNHHPCLLTLPFRTGCYLLFPPQWMFAGNPKIIVTPLLQGHAKRTKIKSFHIIIHAWTDVNMKEMLHSTRKQKQQ